MTLQALGNISVFPQFLSIIFFGESLTMLQSLLVSTGIVLLFYTAYSLFETQTKIAIEVMLCLLCLLVWLFGISLLLGVPLVLIIEAFFKLDLPIWTATPLGVATLLSLTAFSNNKNQSRRIDLPKSEPSDFPDG